MFDDLEKITFISAGTLAVNVQEKCTLAYWMESQSPRAAEYHREELDKYFRRLAETLGYTVTREEPADADA